MKQEILIPSYYNEFKCIGSACEDTCCAGWKVSVDKESFNKYRKITTGPLAEDLKKNISRERKTPSDTSYGKIKLDNQGRCTLLAEDGLCRIHAELGEEYLCHTCTTYPRHVYTVDERLEKSMTVSCPEAARLILMNPDGIDFLIEEEEEDVKQLTLSQTAPHFWDIRMFAIELLQTRSTTIENRLIIFGLFLEKLNTIEKSLWSDALPELFERYRHFINEPAQIKLLQNLPNNIAFQMDLVSKLVQIRTEQGLTNQRYVDCLNDLIQGLQIVQGGTVEQSTSLYNSSFTNYYTPFMTKNSYLLENYLVNFIFNNLFPKETSGIFEQYSNMIIHFVLIKLHAIGMANQHNGLTEDLVITCIQSFSKTFEHNTRFFTDVLEMLNTQQYVSMAHMTVLIKS